MTFTIDRARSYISAVRWQFATTMPQWPHEYTVRVWRVASDADFAAFAAFIRETGTVKPWPRDSATPRYHHTYLAIDGWEYWTMGEPIDETTVINRARLEPDKQLLVLIKPPKPVAQMTDAEYHAWGVAVAGRLFDALHPEGERGTT